jgi:hypothetical protein
MRYFKLLSVCGIWLFSVMLLLPETAIENGGRVQGQTPAQEKAAALRSQLSEVEARQSELQTRLQKLDENLKSESIEHSLAGIGSTHPEDLREQRRRQLEIERNGVQAQLNLLATSHIRLESAIMQADAEAYRQSAAPVTANTAPTRAAPAGGPSSESTNEVTTPQRPRRPRKKKAKKVRRTHHADTSGVLPQTSHGVLPQTSL